VSAVSQGQEAKLCHIASAGFYATDGVNGVLLDALFGDGMDGYEVASDELNKKMENAEGSFADVQLVFASHFHEDHMTGKAILRHLRANSKAVAVIPEQARTVLASSGIQPNDQAQVNSFKLPIGEQVIPKDMPFPVTLFGISHGEGKPIENIAITVTVAGKTIMHVGDMDAKEKDLRKAGVDKVAVDYLLMPFWYMLSKESAAEINKIFDTKNIIPMHFTPDNTNWMQSMGGLEAVKQRSYSSAKNIVRLDEEMKCILLK
tara:strand:- start:59308 stop:60090 length:783 start_codon:yes stop_codon:yes gene_type:complete